MYTIKVTLTEQETGDLYTTFEQTIEDCFNAEDFDWVVEQFEELVEYVDNKVDTEETYDMSAYILNEQGEAIY